MSATNQMPGDTAVEKFIRDFFLAHGRYPEFSEIWAGIKYNTRSLVLESLTEREIIDAYLKNTPRSPRNMLEVWIAACYWAEKRIKGQP